MTTLRMIFRHFAADRRGSYAVIFAIAIVPMLIAIGAVMFLIGMVIFNRRLEA